MFHLLKHCRALQTTRLVARSLFSLSGFVVSNSLLRCLAVAGTSNGDDWLIVPLSQYDGTYLVVAPLFSYLYSLALPPHGVPKKRHFLLPRCAGRCYHYRIARNGFGPTALPRSGQTQGFGRPVKMPVEASYQ